MLTNTITQTAPETSIVHRCIYNLYNYTMDQSTEMRQ